MRRADCFGEFAAGADCVAPKGFCFARHEVEPGTFVDVYNLHADAGADEGSLAARRKNLRQPADFIVANSAGKALSAANDPIDTRVRAVLTVRALHRAAPSRQCC